MAGSGVLLLLLLLLLCTVVPSHLSNRLSLTEDCALKIQHVLPDETGLYQCLQLVSPDEPSPPESLSVVSLIEEEDLQGSKLWCEVSSVSGISVRWLHQGRSVDQDTSEIIIRYLRKASVLSLPKNPFLYQVKHLLECEVTEHGTCKRIFSFIKTPDGPTRSGLKLRYLVVSVLLSSLLLCLSVTVLYTYISGCKRKSDQSTEEAVFYEDLRESLAALRILRHTVQ
uniref:Ig-like domain-containing protein n=1 Tax=Knipowitschia caucasica TaxID=637954 RepID=A0AAV2K2H4_KNICA